MDRDAAYQRTHIGASLRWAVFLALSLLGCKVTPRSTAKIVGGVADDQLHPMVVGMFFLPHAPPLGGSDQFGTCTGAIISDRLVLTAAHCVHDMAGTKNETNFTLATFFFQKKNFSIDSAVFSTAIALYPTYRADLTTPSNDNADVAVAIYPAGTFGNESPGKVAAFAAKSIAVGDTGYMVGYGLTNRTDMSANANRGRFVGTNTVKKVDDNRAGLISFVDSQTDETHAHLAPGDSGGPLLNSEDQIMGIAHVEYTSGQGSSDGSQTFYSRYINAADPGIRCFIDALINDKNPGPQSGQACTPTAINDYPTTTDSSAVPAPGTSDKGGAPSTSSTGDKPAN